MISIDQQGAVTQTNPETTKWCPPTKWFPSAAINGWSCGHGNFLIFNGGVSFMRNTHHPSVFSLRTRRYASSYGRSWPEETEAVFLTRHFRVSWLPIFLTNYGEKIMYQLSQWKTRRKYQRIRVRLLLRRNSDSIVTEKSWTDVGQVISLVSMALQQPIKNSFESMF